MKNYDYGISMANFTNTDGKKIIFPAVKLKITGDGETIDRNYSIKRLFEGKHNTKACYDRLIEAVLKQLNDDSYASRAARHTIATMIQIHPDGKIRKNPFFKDVEKDENFKNILDENGRTIPCPISMKSFDAIKAALKPTDTSWLLIGQLSDKGQWSPANLEKFMDQCSPKEIIETLFGLGYLNTKGEFTDKFFDDLPYEKQKIIWDTFKQKWFQDVLETIDFAWMNTIRQSQFHDNSKSIGELRDEIDHFAGDDRDQTPNPLAETESSMSRDLSDSRNYGYNLNVIDYPIARIFSLDKMIMNHPVFKKYTEQEVYDFLWVSGRKLILNEIMHVQDLRGKLEPVLALKGDQFFTELDHILRMADGLSYEMVQVRKALETHIIQNLSSRNYVYSTYIETLVDDLGNKQQVKTVITYDKILNEIEEKIHDYITTKSCAKSINGALASIGMYGAGKKALSPFYDPDENRFYDLDWTVKTKKEILDQIAVEFESWCDDYYAKLGQGKNADRTREALEIKSDSESPFVLSLDGIKYKSSSQEDDDVIAENDPNFTWNCDYDIGY